MLTVPQRQLENSSALVIPKVVELHFASTEEGLTDANFVVLPPEKAGKLQAVQFADAKVIRRTIGTENQLCKREIVQKCDPATGIPKYTLNDPNNSSGVGRAPRNQIDKTLTC